jgi:hypothetical protein
MGKRSNFERKERDFYPTPLEAVLPLLPHLAPGTAFIEPCAGDGALIRHLEAHGHVCTAAFDIEPMGPGIERKDAMEVRITGGLFITNPPWERAFLHPLIRHLATQGEAWLLFDADWVHTVQAAPFEAMLAKVVSVGRVKWEPDSDSTGKDNAAWHHFTAPVHGREPVLRLRNAVLANPNQAGLFA